jgi:hypothetical protein
MTERATINGSQYGYSLYEFEVYGKSVNVINIPGTFNSLDYSNKSSEISDNNDNNGKYIGNLVNGSSVEYLINVSAAGLYTLSIEAAASGTNSRTITVFSGQTNLGTLSVVNGDNWFNFAALKTNITLAAGSQTLRLVTTGAVNIKDISILAAANLTVNVNIPENGVVYSGAAITPAVSVKEGNATLAEEYYGVTYENNTNAGTAKVKVVGKNNYSSLNYEQSFTIGKKDLTITLKEKQYSIRLQEDLPDFSAEIKIEGLVGGDNASVIKTGNAAFQTSDIIVSCGYDPDDPYPGNYRLQLLSEQDLSANNYNISFGEGVLQVIDPNASPIRYKQPRSSKFGILIEQNPVRCDFAKIEVKAPKEAKEVSVTIYDNTGNVVFSASGRRDTFEWDLTNAAGRPVANGAYLAVVEAKTAGGKAYNYTAKIGVKR